MMVSVVVEIVILGDAEALSRGLRDGRHVTTLTRRQRVVRKRWQHQQLIKSDRFHGEARIVAAFV